MSRETVVEKARRYLVAGRLIVTQVGDDRIRAKCRGGETYRLGFDAGQWWCTCAARGDCSHLVALRLVTVQPARPERRS